MKDLLKKIQPYYPFLLALGGGAIMPYAFAPFHIGVASILSCILFLKSLDKQQPRKAFLIGWCYGIAMFGLGVSWVYVSIHLYGEAPPLLAGFITGLFIILLGLFPASLAGLLNHYFKRDLIRCLLAFPALWVLFEILRGWILSGFPWLYVGYSQMSNHLRAFAPLGSVWAVSWVTVLLASIIYAILEYYYRHTQNKKLRNGLFLGLFTIWISAFGLQQIVWTAPSERKLDVGLVQGNIPQLMRWDPEQLTHILHTYQALTQEAMKNNVIVWPEGAIPVPVSQAQSLLVEWDQFTKAQDIALFSGIPTLLENQRYYNSLIGIGAASGVYHKRHLVPFGEYVPLEQLLRGLIGFFNLPMSDFVPGASQQAPLIAHGLRFAPAICYEIAYPMLVQSISKSADFILTISNDTWFGKSIGPAQHLQIAQFRALEMGKYVVRATNSGFTAIIDPSGQIQSMAPQFEPYVLSDSIWVMEGQTAWSRYGIWPLLGLLVLALGAGWWLQSIAKE